MAHMTLGYMTKDQQNRIRSYCDENKDYLIFSDELGTSDNGYIAEIIFRTKHGVIEDPKKTETTNGLLKILNEIIQTLR